MYDEEPRSEQRNIDHEDGSANGLEDEEGDHQLNSDVDENQFTDNLDNIPEQPVHEIEDILEVKLQPNLDLSMLIGLTVQAFQHHGTKT